ncbi:RNA-binding protein 20 [Erpetoichthys calabaricus]|uniref:RNA-binding protein 20 n=1 Tax=Erpetoichthys calabaricus TaxID=27687 RepID=UPI002234CF9D|nr:RNA-binding protein 20 [Erpetoichthys calabaricus]XP_051778123.1 RNA-binding protein 20 [Erpetoichthys calabaricus]
MEKTQEICKLVSKKPGNSGPNETGSTLIRPSLSQSVPAPKYPEKKAFPLGTPVPGGGQNPLLLTPASLQLAQLQAQLTLHRLKLAQTAVNSNTAAAATVLNQVLSKVAMSQPIFNQLRTPTMVSTPHGHAGGVQLGAGMSVAARLSSAGLHFTPPNTGIGPIVGRIGCPSSLHASNASALGLNHFGGMVSQAPNQHTSAPTKPEVSLTNSGYSDHRNKVSLSTPLEYIADTSRCSQYNFLTAVPSASPGKSAEGQYMPSNQALLGNPSGLQQDFYSSSSQGQQVLNMQTANYSGEQIVRNLQQGSHKDLIIQGKCPASQWQGQVSFSTSCKPEVASTSAGVWTPLSQPFHVRSELYDPEEPTTDSKFNPSTAPLSLSQSATNNQGYMGFQRVVQTEDKNPQGLVLPLQPHQINDFHAVTPSHLPHVCSICDKKVFNLKDWDQHVNGKLHLQKRMLFSESSASGPANFPAFSDGSLSISTASSMDYTSTGPQGSISSFKSSAAIRSKSHSIAGYSSQSGSKRSSVPGRVVHICNLPEGSCTENDVINLGLPFGKVTNYILMRSTNQAFLEMAYVEAAQAMVQYYQQKPAMINKEKLLIRMSKRYKELQLKKPGKDVQSIIHDINSQRERDVLHDTERYPMERTRSRSPVSRSLSPRSHSPSFTSCSSSHSPLILSRGDWSNGYGEKRPSWNPSPHAGREEEEDGGELSWRNQEDDPADPWMQERKRSYLRQKDKSSPRTVEERQEGMRGNRDRYVKNASHSSYQDQDDDNCKKEVKNKSEKSQKQQQYDAKTRKKKTEGHQKQNEGSLCGSEILEDSSAEGKARRISEERSQTDTKKMRETIEKRAKSMSESEEKDDDEYIKNKKESLNPDHKYSDSESGNDTEEDTWYPHNMEELVTVDEIGDDEENIIEPDIPELDEEIQNCTPPAEHSEYCNLSLDVAEIQKQIIQDNCDLVEGNRVGDNSAESEEIVLSDLGDKSLKEAEQTMDSQNECCEISQDAELLNCPAQGLSTGHKITNLLEHVRPVSPTILIHQQNAEEQKVSSECQKNVKGKEICETEETKMDPKVLSEDALHILCQPLQRTALQSHSPAKPEMEGKKAHSSLPSWDHENVFSELGIPLGVEFVVPRTGFYCKLCGLFYTSEETAKISHCRSTVHYRNLQKYLSQLAKENLNSMHENDVNTEEIGIVPQFEEITKPC